MKNFFLGTGLVLISLIFSACGTNKVDIALSNLAEVRYNIFSVESEEFVATFMSGIRENPYIVNGKCEDTVEFGMLTIKYQVENKPLTAQYNLKINEEDFTGNLEYNTYDGTLMVDINKIVDDDATIVLSIITDQENTTVTLTPKTDDLDVTWRSALEIAINELGDVYQSYINKGNLNGEVYVKIITDLNGSFDTYYWYVSIVGYNGSTNGIIIDPHTGEVIAKN